MGEIIGKWNTVQHDLITSIKQLKFKHQRLGFTYLDFIKNILLFDKIKD